MTHWIGIALVVVPILILGAILLRRPTFTLLVVLLAAGLGYLYYTGEVVSVGMGIVSSLRDMIGIDVGELLPTN
jgi:hypothetical protein